MFRTVIEAVGDRASVIAGTGTYDTRHTIALTKRRRSAASTPSSSSRPTTTSRPSAACIEHFKAVAAASPLPVIIYNIPGAVGGQPLAGRCSPCSARSRTSSPSSRPTPTSTISRGSSSAPTSPLRRQRRHARSTCSRSAASAASAWPATSSARGWPRCAAACATAACDRGRGHRRRSAAALRGPLRHDQPHPRQGGARPARPRCRAACGCRWSRPPTRSGPSSRGQLERLELL